jgi:hypothetical protein
MATTGRNLTMSRKGVNAYRHLMTSINTQHNTPTTLPL